MHTRESSVRSRAKTGAQFRTTRWTRVCKACRLDTPSATEALSQLCRDYWYPLYAFVRRRGHSPPDAQDLTQSFFARLLEKQYLQRADPERGRFRTFLLTSLDHFLANEWDKNQTVKRGGQCSFVSWDELQAEDRYRQEPFHDLTPEKLFDRRWAMKLMENAMAALRREYERAGELGLFDALHGHLSGASEAESYQAVAARLGLAEGAVKMRVHRLKRRFGALLREEVANTVNGSKELEEEMKHLSAVWS